MIGIITAITEQHQLIVVTGVTDFAEILVGLNSHTPCVISVTNIAVKYVSAHCYKARLIVLCPL